ncbi:MAG: YHS domain-containing protein [FCB group bacterium]|nr:YHS domain-containing protein [FCB group bacterium]
MKKLFQAVLLLSFTFLFAFSAFAENKNAQETPKSKKELKNQTNCPVMGGKIDSTYYTDIQGQRVYFCCPMCPKKFKADPDKYFQKAAKEGILFENIQKNCPVSGKELTEKTVYIDYEGRRIYFCCPDCQDTFNKDPKEYLSQMDKKETPHSQNTAHDTTNKTKTKQNNQGHNH